MNQTDCSLQTNTDATTATLRALLQQMCRVPVDVLRPHFPLLVTHILRALSHMEIRSISIISQLATNPPPLQCAESVDLDSLAAVAVASLPVQRHRRPVHLFRQFAEQLQAAQLEFASFPRDNRTFH